MIDRKFGASLKAGLIESVLVLLQNLMDSNWARTLVAVALTHTHTHTHTQPYRLTGCGWIFDWCCWLKDPLLFSPLYLPSRTKKWTFKNPPAPSSHPKHTHAHTLTFHHPLSNWTRHKHVHLVRLFTPFFSSSPLMPSGLRGPVRLDDVIDRTGFDPSPSQGRTFFSSSLVSFNLVSSFMAFKKSCALETRGIRGNGRDGSSWTGLLMDFMLPFIVEFNFGFVFVVST